MAGNIYLYLDGIPGESTSRIFTSWIDISSFSIGNAMEIDMDSRKGSGGGTSGAADPEDLSLETKMSIASPVLLQCCALGAIIPRGRLIQCNVVNTDLNVVSDYSFGDSVISSVNLSGSGGDIPSQSFTINYGSIIWRYHCYNHYHPWFHEAEVVREWSILASNPKRADPNTYDALNIANKKVFSTGGIVDSSGQRKKPDQVHYDDFGGNSRVIFKPGVTVHMEEDAENLERG